MEGKLSIKVRNLIDGQLKFPGLRKGETGLQIGFDMESKNLTTDLVVIMFRRVGSAGLVVGIDPDPSNHERFQAVIDRHALEDNIRLVRKATHFEQGRGKLLIARRASWNKLESVANGLDSNFTDQTIQVELDTVDHIIGDLGLEVASISHVNITNNGAEYDTLKGMTGLLENARDLSLTVVSGRPPDMGIIKGRPDYEVVQEFLEHYGFETRFARKENLLWWSLVHELLAKKRFVFFKENYGVVMAGKGSKRIKPYQSYS